MFSFLPICKAFFSKREWKDNWAYPTSFPSLCSLLPASSAAALNKDPQLLHQTCKRVPECEELFTLDNITPSSTSQLPIVPQLRDSIGRRKRILPMPKFQSFPILVKGHSRLSALKFPLLLCPVKGATRTEGICKGSPTPAVPQHLFLEPLHGCNLLASNSNSSLAAVFLTETLLQTYEKTAGELPE